MRCLAVDDEPLALNIIKGFCAKTDFLELVACASSALEAQQILAEEPIDLLFLDINMPQISGVQFAESTRDLPMIIFTTAYSDYAVKGFDLDAVDYLLKPFSFARFLKAVTKAYDRHRQKELSENPHAPSSDQEEQTHLMVKVEYSMIKVSLEEILFVEGLKDYIKICCIERKPVVTKSTMKNIEQRLPSDTFMRIHKSFIINTSKIEAFENNHLIIGRHRIPLGGQYREAFLKRIGKDIL